MDHDIYQIILKGKQFLINIKIINHKKSSTCLGGSLCQVRVSHHMVNNELIYISNYSSCAGDHFPVFAVSPKMMGTEIEIRPSGTPGLGYLAVHRCASMCFRGASDCFRHVHFNSWSASNMCSLIPGPKLVAIITFVPLMPSSGTLHIRHLGCISFRSLAVWVHNSTDEG